jgi:hypothetical protein
VFGRRCGGRCGRRLPGKPELRQPLVRQAVARIDLKNSLQAVDLLGAVTQHHAQQQPTLFGVRMLLEVARQHGPRLGRPPGPNQVSSLAQFLR